MLEGSINIQIISIHSLLKLKLKNTLCQHYANVIMILQNNIKNNNIIYLVYLYVVLT